MPPKRKAQNEVTVEVSLVKKQSSKQTPPDYQGPGYYNLVENLHDEVWKEKLADVFKEDYFKNLQEALTKEAKANIEIFPPQEDVFTAFNLTPFNKIKIVILGQDPYHDNNQAHGLAFSVREPNKTPPSLKNIFKELEADIEGFKTPEHRNLEKWAKEGILLLNATLTVQAHKANSHAKLGWQKFSDAVISKISRELKGIVFILWGDFAQKKESLITGDDPERHKIIMEAHPSSMSYYKFRGCKCFSKANQYLKELGKDPVNWQL